MTDLDDVPVAIDVDGDVAYLVTGSSVETWDVSDPSSPRRLGKTVDSLFIGFGPYAAPRVFKSGDDLYVATDSVVYMVDVSRPAQPAALELAWQSGVDLVAGPADVGYRVMGGRLDAVQLGQGEPQALGPALEIGEARLAVKETTVYALETEDPSIDLPRIQVIDASDPTSLRLVTSVAPTEPSWDQVYNEVLVVGNHLFLCSPSDITVWDVTSPLDPQPMGHLVMPDYVWATGYNHPGPISLSAWGDRLLIAQNGGGVTVVEVNH